MPAPTPYRLLRDAWAVRRRDNLLALVCAAGHQAGEALVPVIVGLAIDRGVAAGEVDQLVLWLAAVTCVFALLSNSYVAYARLSTRAATAAAVALRLRVTDHLLDPRGVGGQDHAAGGLTSIAADDVAAVGRANSVAFLFSGGLGGFGVAAVSLFTIDVVVGLVVVGGSIPVVAGMHLLGIPLERRMIDERAGAAAAADTAGDLVRGLRVVKGLGAEETASHRFAAVSRRSLHATIRAARVGGLFEAVLVLATGLFVAVVAVVAGRMALAGDIGIGAFVAALGLAQFLVGPLMMLAAATATLAECRSAAVRVAGLLARPAPSFGAVAPSAPVRGELRVAGPGTGVDAGEVTVPGGSLTGVVAPPAAAGALVAALTGEPRPGGAGVTLDGVPLTELDVTQLRRAVVVAPHHGVLFAGTLRENVAAAAGPEAVAEAARVAAVDAVVAELPDGWDAAVGEGGHRLSGGQRQRVALARALAARPPVLVLHEPTSAVDSVTEAGIAARLADVRRGLTTVVVTTSPALLAACDHVVWLDGGGPRSGRHDDLVRLDGYAAAVLR